MNSLRMGLRELDKLGQGVNNIIAEGDSLCAIRLALGSFKPPWRLTVSLKSCYS